MDPPLADSYLNTRYNRYTDYGRDQVAPLLAGNGQNDTNLEMGTPSGSDDRGDTTPGPGLTTSILMSSSTVVELPTVRESRRRWTWLQYLCWLIPTMWCTVLYIVQLVCGTMALGQIYWVAVYNLSSGCLGLVITVIRVWDCWIYVVPLKWLSEADLAEKPPSCLREWGMFALMAVLDSILFIINVMGSTYSLTLYGSDYAFTGIMMVFAVANLVWQFSRYGLLVFSLKIFAPYILKVVLTK